jgi:hypothetical protein
MLENMNDLVYCSLWIPVLYKLRNETMWLKQRISIS